MLNKLPGGGSYSTHPRVLSIPSLPYTAKLSLQAYTPLMNNQFFLLTPQIDYEIFYRANKI